LRPLRPLEKGYESFTPARYQLTCYACTMDRLPTADLIISIKGE
jgi:hypothetical protein